MAEKLGHDLSSKDFAACFIMHNGFILREFNLEGSAEDREAAVIWLGNSTGIYLLPMGSGIYGVMGMNGEVSPLIHGYAEALFAAIDYLMENKDDE